MMSAYCAPKCSCLNIKVAILWHSWELVLTVVLTSCLIKDRNSRRPDKPVLDLDSRVDQRLLDRFVIKAQHCVWYVRAFVSGIVSSQVDAWRDGLVRRSLNVSMCDAWTGCWRLKRSEDSSVEKDIKKKDSSTLMLPGAKYRINAIYWVGRIW